MTVSVVIATYNGDKFLREQFDSLLDQTLMPDEIIVADDRSTDATWDIIMEYKTRFPNLFVVYQNEKRLGPHANFKNAFKYAKCDLIAPCDQDDIWQPEKLERSVNALNEGYSMVFCQEIIQYESGKKYETHYKKPTMKECVFCCTISGHLMVFRRELLEVFNIAPEITYDWGISLISAVLGTITGIDYVGCIWRRHKNVVTLEHSDYNKTVIEKKGKWFKYMQTIKLLGKGEKSAVIERRLHNVAQIISKALVSLSSKERKVRKLAFKIADEMSQQTVWGLIKASVNYLRLNNYYISNMKPTLRERIGSSLYSFCYPAIWWYDYHNHKAL